MPRASRFTIPADVDTAVVTVESREVRLTNLPKSFWPERGIAKRDLLQYYADVSSVLLPHIRDRAMVMKRYPNGAGGPFFFMKRAPAPRPEWNRICTIDHGNGNVIAFPVIDEPAGAHDWRRGLPALAGARISVRGLRVSDASSLFAMLSGEEVTRFISPPPPTLETFERFIRWANREREAGNYLCFAITPADVDVAIGLIQVRQLEPTFETAEWGFALGSAFWGTGMFAEAAGLVLDFAFRTVGVHRMEARAAVQNGRGAGALRKLGAVQEGVLRRSFHRNGGYHDQVLWTIVADEWRRAPERFAPRVH